MTKLLGKRPSVHLAKEGPTPKCSQCAKRTNALPSFIISWSVCFFKLFQRNQPSGEPSDFNFLDAVSSQSTETTARVKVSDREVASYIDRDVEVTAISKDDYKAIGHCKFHYPFKTHHGPFGAQTMQHMASCLCCRFTKPPLGTASNFTYKLSVKSVTPPPPFLQNFQICLGAGHTEDRI